MPTDPLVPVVTYDPTLADAYHAALRALMPHHGCGRRMEPGQTPSAYVLSCPPCSHVEAVDPVWATTQANAALLAVTAPQLRAPVSASPAGEQETDPEGETT